MNERLRNLSMTTLVEHLTETDSEIEKLSAIRNHDEDTIGYLNSLHKARHMILDAIDRKGQREFVTQYREFGRVV